MASPCQGPDGASPMLAYSDALAASFRCAAKTGSALPKVALLCRKPSSAHTGCATRTFVMETALCQECVRRSVRKGMTELTKIPKRDAGGGWGERRYR